MSWQREYKGPRSTIMAFFVGFVFLFIGAIFTLLMGWVGLLIVAGGVLFPVLILWLGTEQTILCNEQGFVIRRSSRRHGTSESAYAWLEVTATDYFERRSDSQGAPRGHFAVDTVRGRAFVVTEGTRGFRDLIELFNAMTIQLPYVWLPQMGFSVSVGPARVGRGAYHAVPRNGAAQQ